MSNWNIDYKKEYETLETHSNKAMILKCSEGTAQRNPVKCIRTRFKPVSQKEARSSFTTVSARAKKGP